MMKKFIVILATLIIPISVFAYTSPGKPMGYANDFAGILSVEQKNNLESISLGLKQNTGFEVAIVTVKTLGDETVETYATKLFEEWGIGDEKKDTGILLLVAVDERAVRIETGYGSEGAVTDIQSGNIIRSIIVPEFQKGDYYTGLSGAMNALTLVIQKSPEAEQYSQSGNGVGTNGSDSGFSFEALFFIFIIFINVFAKILGKTKSWWLGGVIGAIAGGIIGLIFGFVMIGIGSIILLTIFGLVFDYLVSKKGGLGGGPHGGWIFPMGGFGGHGGGGFGGFGGGMSGGGGASGRW